MTLDPAIQAAIERWDDEPPPPPLSPRQQDIISAAFQGAITKAGNR
jgi:hypothetical protein